MGRRSKLILVILDGLGLTLRQEGNAFWSAQTPNIDRLLSTYPSFALTAHGKAVGLPSGIMGNSEVGHLHLGSGRVISQEASLIDQAINDQGILDNAILTNALKFLDKNSTLHIITLLSSGSVHGNFKHLAALLKLTQSQHVIKIVLHAITDGRDSPPRSALEFIEFLNPVVNDAGAHWGSVSGRFYAMDRDRNWQRTQQAYNAIFEGVGEQANSIEEAIQSNYERGISDEMIKPTIIGAPNFIKDGDTVIFTNFRADRIRQLVRAAGASDFKDFTRPMKNIHIITFADYGVDLINSQVAFARELVVNPIGQVWEKGNLRQFHIAETEKYAHVTYFFNGGREEPFINETRALIKSPQVQDYATTPAMSADKILTELIARYQNHSFDCAVVNFANLDMVGHTGNFAASVQAMQLIDQILGQLTQICESLGDTLIITADHGNVEELLTPAGTMSKEHSVNLVPLIVINPKLKKRQSRTKQQLLALPPQGSLIDVAPTILALQHLSMPPEMTGQNLL